VGHALRVIVSAAADPLYAINPQKGDDYVGGKPEGWLPFAGGPAASFRRMALARLTA